MRIAAGLIFAGAISFVAAGTAFAQAPASKGLRRTAAGAGGQGCCAGTAGSPCSAGCSSPAARTQGCVQQFSDALGVSRVVQIDTAGGPGFGFEHFKQLDFRKDKEVVLTFDDGPWPGNTPAVLKALADECTTGIFFSIGKHATYYPEILKQVAAAGHTVGSHTWGHTTLTNKKLSDQRKRTKSKKASAR